MGKGNGTMSVRLAEPYIFSSTRHLKALFCQRSYRTRCGEMGILMKLCPESGCWPLKARIAYFDWQQLSTSRGEAFHTHTLLFVSFHRRCCRD